MRLRTDTGVAYGKAARADSFRGNRQMSDILISIKPRYVDMILAGAKGVELRKRNARIAPGTRILIYSTSPRKALVGEASISFVERLPVEALFKRHGKLAKITREDFDAYYIGHDEGVALGLELVMSYADPVPLDVLRAINGGFMPPQSYMRAPAAIAALAGARKRGSSRVRVGQR